jgi:hypothetical protein
MDKRLKRMHIKLDKLLRLETKLRKQAERAARPLEQKAHRTHLEWVKLRNKIIELERPPTLDDAFGSSEIHGCNPCH